MAVRDLEKEKIQVDQFVQSQGREPSNEQDWKTVHTATYGTELPSDLAGLPMYLNQNQPNTGITPELKTTGTTPAPGGSALSYMGENISDPALAGARAAYEPWRTPQDFLGRVKERMQSKFKPETETLGIGSFSATLGPLDPSGVMKGINEKTGQFRHKGALALQALSTANDLYSEQAGIAFENLNRLEGLRGTYEQEQKQVEQEMEALALSIAKTGKDIPEDLLAFLSPEKRTLYQSLPGVFKADDPFGTGSNEPGDRWRSSGLGDLFVVEQGSGYDYECGKWARTRGDYAGGAGMGDEYTDKQNWVNTYGETGIDGLKVGDLVITNGADVGSKGSFGHALIVGGFTEDGNIIAYESNAAGDHAVTYGREVNINDPAIYGYVSGNMSENEITKMNKGRTMFGQGRVDSPEDPVVAIAKRVQDGTLSVPQMVDLYGPDVARQVISGNYDIADDMFGDFIQALDEAANWVVGMETQLGGGVAPETYWQMVDEFASEMRVSRDEADQLIMNTVRFQKGEEVSNAAGPDVNLGSDFVSEEIDPFSNKAKAQRWEDIQAGEEAFKSAILTEDWRELKPGWWKPWKNNN